MKKLITFLTVAQISLAAEINFRLQETPKTLDISMMSEAYSVFIASSVFEGLVRTGEHGEIVKGCAESWKEDGDKVVFNIRKDAKWANGEKVTAYDFLFSFKRLLDAETGSEYSFIAHKMNIINAIEFTDGKVPFDKVGIKALNERQIEFSLTQKYKEPVKVLAPLLGWPGCAPINPKFYSDNQDAFGREEEGVLSNGPWMVREWHMDEKLVLVKNPHYHTPEVAKIDRITALIVRDSTTAANMYNTGELDFIPMVESNYIGHFDKSEIVPFSKGRTQSLHFNTEVSDLSNVNLRRAINFAIDRKVLATKVLRGEATPSYSISPEGFQGENGDYAQEVGNLFEDGDLDVANRYLEKAKKELGKDSFSFTIIVANTEDEQKVAQFIQNELNKKLGIKITVESMSKNLRISRQMQSNFEIVVSGWGADYPGVPSTFLDMWTTTSSINRTGWSNAEFDKHITASNNAYSISETVKHLKAAEKILIGSNKGEFPIVPLYFPNEAFAVKPYLKGVKMYIGSTLPDFRNAFVK